MGKALSYACVFALLLAFSTVAYACDFGGFGNGGFGGFGGFNSNATAMRDCAAHPGKKVLITECYYYKTGWTYRHDNNQVRVACALVCADAKVQARSILGTVAASDTNDTLPGAAVTLTRTDNNDNLKYVWNMTTDANGYFVFPEAIQGPGTYTVDVDADQYISQSQTVNNTKSKKGVAMYFNMDPIAPATAEMTGSLTINSADGTQIIAAQLYTTPVAGFDFSNTPPTYDIAGLPVGSFSNTLAVYDINVNECDMPITENLVGGVNTVNFVVDVSTDASGNLVCALQ